ncbi:MAG: NAD/NADP octopine/nopaline dehydrogenase family protein [Deltaproteobacteria bacterium]|nr:NAD/NADP octopine/nopaline dehydrogenase family protein [Deltaproteobacteria bacterium]MBW2121434.1 NAD/NADP octopine/nopaline dehydrogenase family protein [Deltaproteobacteria bacterium]
MGEQDLRFAVLGSGNSGHAFAADISLKGFRVNLADLPQFKANIEAIREKGGIEITGESSKGFARLDMVTTDLEKAVRGVDIILIAAPANAHEPFSRALAPFFEDGQFIVFVSNFGALRFRNWMAQMDVKTDVTPVETQSLVYATRFRSPGSVEVFAVKNQLPAAALPARRTGEFVEKMSRAFPEIVAGENILFTSLNNLNPVVHPPMTLLNTGRIESTLGKGWNLYGDGATESVAKVMLSVDAERMALLDLLGVGKSPIKESFTRFYKKYGVEGETLSQLLRKSPIHANPTMSAPSSMNDRYVTEDIPFGLVPWSSMGHMWSSPTQTIDAVIQIASVIEGVDYFKEGITVKELGIEGMSPEQVRDMVE